MFDLSICYSCSDIVGRVRATLVTKWLHMIENEIELKKKYLYKFVLLSLRQCHPSRKRYVQYTTCTTTQKLVDYGCRSISFRLENVCVRLNNNPVIIIIEILCVSYRSIVYSYNCLGCCLHFKPSTRMSHGRLTTIKCTVRSCSLLNMVYIASIVSSMYYVFVSFTLW